LEALTKRGHHYASESARAIIRRRIQSGLSPRPPLDQFAWEVLAMDIDLYGKTPVTDRPAFFDRGVVDALALVSEQDVCSPVEVEAHISEFPYNETVFMFPPWEDIYRTDAERDQSFSESVQVYERLVCWYAQWKYQPVEVPTVDIDARVDFILQTVDNTLARTRS
ncbi:MAG: AAA family ATPase, partial [Candidatus Tectomicrobia bacterium]|nr:AAA family ATPase [Candidatus Tectomicrobia bacterium]